MRAHCNTCGWHEYASDMHEAIMLIQEHEQENPGHDCWVEEDFL
jgi:hypothetical protein